MSTKQVKELRQTGKLDEAYKMAADDLDKAPDDVWAKRSMVWCLYEYAKARASFAQWHDFIRCLQKMADLHLPADEDDMITRSVGWLLRSVLDDFHKCNQFPQDFFTQLFAVLPSLPRLRPSVDTSKLVHTLLHICKDDDRCHLPDFFDWWGWEIFSEADYHATEYNGQQQMALAENAYLAYSKAMLARLERKEITPESVQNYIDQHLDSIISRYTDMQYPLYYKVKLLLAMGKRDGLTDMLRPFVLKKANDFWVWELLGQVANDADMTYSCYCKALTCRNKEEMLVGVRGLLARVLVQKEMYVEAKYEMEKVLDVRQKNNWKMPSWLQQLISQPWYATTTAARDNRDLYKANTATAEAFLYANLSDVPVLVTNFNAAKSAVRFVTRDKKVGFFFSNRIKGMSKLAFAKGQVWLCRFAELKEEAPSQVCACHQVTDHSHDEGFLMDFAGPIHVGANGIGFVKSIFVPQSLTQSVATGDKVTGTAMLAFDRKKSKWGWQACSVEKKTEQAAED